jgi:hypothetical protein
MARRRTGWLYDTVAVILLGSTALCGIGAIPLAVTSLESNAPTPQPQPLVESTIVAQQGILPAILPSLMPEDALSSSSDSEQAALTPITLTPSPTATPTVPRPRPTFPPTATPVALIAASARQQAAPTTAPTSAAGPPAQPTSTPLLPTAVPPTAMPPTAVPTTAIPPTAVPPTAIPPTATAGTTVAPPIAEGPLVTVNLEPIADLLANPGIGWQDTDLFHPRFPQMVSYARPEWQVLNPAEGVYDWSALERLRTAATTFSFGVKTASSPPWGSGQAVPQWVVDKGALMVNSREDAETAYEPIYHNCIFLEEHARFIEALRQRYDGDPDVEFIDIRSYGFYGEWHTPQYNEDVNSLDYNARIRIAEMYIGGSGTRPCSMPDGSIQNVSYSYVGFQRTQLVMPYTPWFQQTLLWVFENRRRDIGIRHDALGSPGHQDAYRAQIGGLVQQIWPYEPIVFEFSSNAWTDANLISARQFILEMHGSVVHDNLSGQGTDTLIRDLLTVTGYRLLPRTVTYSASVKPGEGLALAILWQNVGSAPPYAAYPVMAYLTDSTGGTVVAQWQLAVDTRTWLPGDHSYSETLAVPADVAPGLYTLRLAVIDPHTQIPLNLAVAGRDAYGRYPVGTVEIGSAPSAQGSAGMLVRVLIAVGGSLGMLRYMLGGRSRQAYRRT